MSVGTRVGGYQVTAALGAGGMGEVYRARDTKLQRDVAFKILPDLSAWGRDGRELFYFDGTSRLTGVAVQTADRFTASRPEKLLDAKYFSGGLGVSSRTYDLSMDGTRFLMIKDDVPFERATSSLVVELNWRDALRARLGRQ